MPTAAAVRSRRRQAPEWPGAGAGSGMIGRGRRDRGTQPRQRDRAAACAARGAARTAIAATASCRQRRRSLPKNRQGRCFRVRGSVMSLDIRAFGGAIHTMPIRAILFDKDGTLVDFQRTWGPATYDRAIAALRWRPRGLRARRRRQPVSTPSARTLLARLADRDRNHLWLRQALGAGARPAADAGIRRRHRPACSSRPRSTI